MPKLKTAVSYTPKVSLAKLPDLDIDDLQDVSITTPATDDILQYSGGQWANSTLVETGSFSPTLDFDTSGDLSNSYAFQDGLYWKIGPIVWIQVLCNTTPTFTTASGNLQIGSLPYTAQDVSNPRAILAAQVGGTGITWPGSGTQTTAIISGNTDYARIVASGTGAAVSNVTASDITSGTSVSVRLAGFYIT